MRVVEICSQTKDIGVDSQSIIKNPDLNSYDYYPPFLKFKTYNRLKVPFVVYADFEALLRILILVNQIADIVEIYEFCHLSDRRSGTLRGSDLNSLNLNLAFFAEIFPSPMRTVFEKLFKKKKKNK